ncbi:hypothetical protein [Bradyrhizobium sp.]|uniref:hypothetical protein n=1 Tax=Bradyrhizobium sp. TaxID=376 RepID=UPI003C3942AB
MKKTGTAIAVLVAAGLAGAPLAAQAKSHKHTRSHSSMTTGSNMSHSSMTTGSNMKSNSSANPSSEGNVGPGTNNNNGPTPGGR